MSDPTWRDGTTDLRTAEELEALLAQFAHAVRHGAVGGDELYALTGGHQSGVDMVFPYPREQAYGSSVTLVSNLGQTVVSMFTFGGPQPSVPMTKLCCVITGAATGGTYHARLVLYSVAADDQVTLLARTADDANLITGAGGIKSAAMAGAGGYLTEWTPTIGERYALGVYSQATTASANMVYRPARPEVMMAPPRTGWRKIIGATATGQGDAPVGPVAMNSYCYGMPFVWAEP